MYRKEIGWTYVEWLYLAYDRKHYGDVINKIGNFLKIFTQITTTNIHSTLNKRHQHNLNEIKNILQRNKLTVAKADNSKTVVIINKHSLKQKIYNFIQENRIIRLNNDPTETNSTRYSTVWRNETQMHKQIANKHKTNSIQTECINKNTQIE